MFTRHICDRIITVMSSRETDHSTITVLLFTSCICYQGLTIYLIWVLFLFLTVTFSPDEDVSLVVRLSVCSAVVSSPCVSWTACSHVSVETSGACSKQIVLFIYSFITIITVKTFWNNVYDLLLVGSSWLCALRAFQVSRCHDLALNCESFMFPVLQGL